MSEELKPCPFCGGPAGDESGPNGDEYVFVIACQSEMRRCAAAPATTSTIDLKTAVAAWNRRASPDARREALEEAKGPSHPHTQEKDA